MSHNLPAEMLRFGYGKTTLGRALVVFSDFRGARLIEDETGQDGAIAQAVAIVDAARLGLDLPLDLRGSELELAGWEVLRAIPPGETRTYGALAKAPPVTATALDVGPACAANVLAAAVPCQRVVKADGSISGYRWGVQRNRDLLARETRA